jgi:putative endonuclease
LTAEPPPVERCAQWYEERGFEVVERQWQRREGEVDLIARHGKLVAFCEITGGGLVLEATQRRTRRLASRWLGEITPASGRSLIAIRFDVATVEAGELHVSEGAFSW